MADDNVTGLINDRGFDKIVLKSNYRDMEAELGQWPDMLQPEIVVVDSYFVTEGYLKRLKDKFLGGKMVYIDDVVSFPYPIDVLVDYNAYGLYMDYDGLYAGSGVKCPELVLGPTYTPLRGMFKGIVKSNQAEVVKDVLVSTGGSDELHLTMKLMKVVGVVGLAGESCCGGSSELVYHFLIGAMNQDREEIYRMAGEMKNVVLHENVSDMRSLIESCDIAISAAGSTTYEISACGVPMVTYSIADNQNPGAEAFEKQGLAVNVGDLRKPESIDATAVFSGELCADAAEQIIDASERLAEDFKLRCKIGGRMQELIDGCGAERLVERLMK